MQTVSASGTNGVDTASFSYTTNCIVNAGTLIIAASRYSCFDSYQQGGYYDVDGEIDGFGGANTVVGLGDGQGEISDLTYPGPPETIAQAPLIGYVSTPVITYSGPDNTIVTGTFLITPTVATPETSTLFLTSFGLIALLMGKRTRRR